MQIDVQTLTILGWLVPLVVGVVTKKCASATVKAVANLALSAVVGGIAVAVTANGKIDRPKEWLLNIVAAFIQSIVAYYGLWRPTGIAPALQSATPNFGLGSNPPASNDDDDGATLSYDEVRAVRDRLHGGSSSAGFTGRWRDELAAGNGEVPTVGVNMATNDVEVVDREPRDISNRRLIVEDGELVAVEENGAQIGSINSGELPPDGEGDNDTEKTTPAAHAEQDKPEKPLDVAEPILESRAELARARRSLAAKKAAETRRRNREEAEAKAKKPAKKVAAKK